MACLLPSNPSSSVRLIFNLNQNNTSSDRNINSLLRHKSSKKKKKNTNIISIQNRSSLPPLISSQATLTESSSSSPSDPPKQEPPFQELADSLAQLPPDYLAQLPNDLRLDLNDAAFDLANGPVIDECGQELGETLLNLSKAWEVADTSTSCNIATNLPSLVATLSDNAKSAFGKRLVSSGRRFQSMGSYGQGELQRIAKAMIETGKLLSASPLTDAIERPKETSRMFKFGELQVAVTSDKAIIGAAISFVFAIISWELGQGIQGIPESSLQYPNDNALLLAKSLRGALLVIGYGSAVLSAFTTLGLILLGWQLKSEEK